MPKITEKELVAIQLRLFKEDHERLKAMFGAEFGVNRAIRTIVHAFVIQAESEIRDAVDAMESEERQ